MAVGSKADFFRIVRWPKYKIHTWIDFAYYSKQIVYFLYTFLRKSVFSSSCGFVLVCRTTSNCFRSSTPSLGTPRPNSEQSSGAPQLLTHVCLILTTTYSQSVSHGRFQRKRKYFVLPVGLVLTLHHHHHISQRTFIVIYTLVFLMLFRALRSLSVHLVGWRLRTSL